MPKLVFKNMPGGWHTNDFKTVRLTRVSWDVFPNRPLAYVFFGHVNIDFDGSPTAYGPETKVPLSDDCLGNGGNSADGYFGVVALRPGDPLVTSGAAIVDRTAPMFLGKQPVIQQAKNGDPKPGYYVSKSSHRHGPIHLQNSYIDSSAVLYGALDSRLLPLGVGMGDFGLALRHDQNRQSGFYFVDGGGRKFALGECSHKVGKNLGVSRLRGRCSWDNNFPVSFMLFPKSGYMHSDPATGEEIGFGVMDLTDNSVEKAIRPLLIELSRASNAEELALLMAFNEVQPGNVPDGLTKLQEFLRTPGRSKSPSYATVKLGLATLGFWPFANKPREETSPFDHAPQRPTQPLIF